MDGPYSIVTPQDMSYLPPSLWFKLLTLKYARLIDDITSNDTLHLFEDLQDDPKARSLPPLPRQSSRLTSPLNKKRDRNETLASSSDPPLFSSDDILASTSENYLDDHRNKRHHRRNWYEQEGVIPYKAKDPSTRSRLRGPFSRKYDSGVWLNSDESTESEQDRRDAVHQALNILGDDGSVGGKNGYLALESESISGAATPEEDQKMILYHKALQTTEDPGDFEGPIFPYWGEQPDADRLQMFHTSQRHALNRVMECVESGKEVVDLS